MKARTKSLEDLERSLICLETEKSLLINRKPGVAILLVPDNYKRTYNYGEVAEMYYASVHTIYF